MTNDEARMTKAESRMATFVIVASPFFRHSVIRHFVIARAGGVACSCGSSKTAKNPGFFSNFV
jgi:hypothetical protein